MSNLDMGAVPAPPPPLELKVAQPQIVTDEKAVSKEIAVMPEAKTKAAALADNFVAELVALSPNSPQFREKYTSVTSIGNREIVASSEVSSRILDRPSRQRKGDSAQVKVAGTLGDLRRTITDLDPNRADLSGAKRLLKWLPGGNKIDEYFDRYRTSQDHLNAIIRALASGQDDLRKDNAAIEVESQHMWDLMVKLKEYAELGAELDQRVEAKANELEAAGNADAAKALRSDVLYAIRQRRQDIATQLAVSMQGYLALGIVSKNNDELIRGVDRAQGTTVAALRTAIIVSEALATQKLVLDQVTALHSTTEELLVGTAAQLRDQGAEIQKQAASSGISPEALGKAFDSVFQAMDELDRFHLEANQSFLTTLNALDTQVNRAKGYVDRAHGNRAIES